MELLAGKARRPEGLRSADPKLLRLAGPGSMQSNESWIGGDAAADAAAAAATGGTAAAGGCGCGGLGLNIAPSFWNFDCTDEREECGV